MGTIIGGRRRWGRIAGPASGSRCSGVEVAAGRASSYHFSSARSIHNPARIIKRTSTVGDQAFFDAANFPWHHRLEDNHQVIPREIDTVLAGADRVPAFQDVSPDQKFLTDDDRWRTFFLYAYGHRVPANCAKCPDTAAMLEQIPGMKTAMFSILSPGKDIPPHRGPYGGVLRYHLGLIIPDDPSSCGIVVNGEKVHWEEGKSLFFDDSFTHQARNHSDQLRVVLFLDIERPVRRPFDTLNRWVIDRFSRSEFVGGVDE